MGTTRIPVQGLFPAPANMCVARSPGPLGWNDAADPNARVCLAGDTPGPAGTGSDAGAALLFSEPRSCDLAFPALAVDLGRLTRFVYTVAYAEATDRATTRGFGSGELQHGEEARIEAEARSAADAVMEQFQESLAKGPLAVQEFIAALEDRKARARASLDNKFAEAHRARNRWVSVLGGIVKGLSVVKFAATTTIKTVSFTLSALPKAANAPAAAMTGIDIVYSAALAANRQLQSPAADKTVQGVVVEETAKNVLQELVGELNALVASGVMTRDEKNKLEGLIGNYRGNAEKLKAQIAELEKKVLKSIEAGQTGKKTAQVSRQLEKRLASLRQLREKSLARLAQNPLRSAAVKHGAGQTLSLVFLASEVSDAYREAAEEWRASD